MGRRLPAQDRWALLVSLRFFFAGTFVLLILAGSLRDAHTQRQPRREGLLVADLHVHPFPGDGVLTTWQLQREASRRGLDVIAVAGHNNRVALGLARALGWLSSTPLILESQELTSPGFHIVAVGVVNTVDWRLPVPDAVRAIHAQGGVAIAAHPVPFAWTPMDDASLRAVDGVEVAHPMAGRSDSSRRELDRFIAAVRAVRPDVAPIGSSDFHGAAPLGLCRTYLLTSDRSAAGALDAIRHGRTVAEDQFGRLYGATDHVAEVTRHLAGQPVPREGSTVDRVVALGALLCLASIVGWRRISE